ncbi:hypothetical protein [Nitratireductor sp. GCM10026969]|uniref:hypothetical protein n=1 Tax=Nitratireductor sp. GCM10026969 TaxID=3252645 RepID=UPI0036213735
MATDRQIEAAKAAFRKAEATPRTIDCPRCDGFGYHHGFGEDGYDPDWCSQCGGGGFDLPEGEEDRPLIAALEAALSAQDGAVGVKALPRNDSGVRGWTLDPEMVREVAHKICRDGWDAGMEEVELAMLDAEKRILASSPSPAQEAGAEPVAYIVHCPDDEIYGNGPDKLQFHPLEERDVQGGYTQTPLFAYPGAK